MSDEPAPQVPDDARPAQRVRAADAHLVEERLRGERLFKGVLLDVRRDTVRLPDGRDAVREYVVHPGAVLVVPRLEDGRLVVERQFRYPNNAVFREFPAGKRDPGEAALDTAKRELREETGYIAARWSRLGVIHPVIASSTETIELFLAEGLTQVGAALDHGEFIEVDVVPCAELLAAADRGEITDAKTLVALFHLQRRHLVAELRARHVIVRGRVQGVGFRDAMRDAAMEAGVTGWVRNRRDGTVEAVIQGTSGAVDSMLQWCRRGPPAAHVTAVNVADVAHDDALTAFARLRSG